MATWFLNILLSFSIFCCPLVCRANLAKSDSGQHHGCACCQKCASAPKSSPSKSSSQECCQCICAGAVLGEFVKVDVDQAIAAHQLVALELMPILCEVTAGIDRVGKPSGLTSRLIPGDNLGRALRLFLGSLVC